MRNGIKLLEKLYFFFFLNENVYIEFKYFLKNLVNNL